MRCECEVLIDRASGSQVENRGGAHLGALVCVVRPHGPRSLSKPGTCLAKSGPSQRGASLPGGRFISDTLSLRGTASPHSGASTSAPGTLPVASSSN